MEDPLLVADDVVELVERADRGRVEQEDPRAAPVDLDEIGALRVSEAGGALSIDGDRAVARSDALDGGEVLLPRRDHGDDGMGELRGLSGHGGRGVAANATHAQHDETTMW